MGRPSFVLLVGLALQRAGGGAASSPGQSLQESGALLNQNLDVGRERL